MCVLTSDGIFWECKVCGTMIPQQCKLKPGAVRVEVKLRKQGIETWTDFCGKDDSKVYM